MGPRHLIVSLPNTPGNLSQVSELLGKNGVDIKAVTCNTDSGKGILCIVLDDHDKGKLVLSANGYDVKESPIIAAFAPDHPGGLNAMVCPLSDAGVNIEKLYLSVGRKGEHNLIIIQVDDYDKGVTALKNNYVELIEGKFKF